jgi:hypothetical protein
MTRKSTQAKPVATLNSRREMLGQSLELQRPYFWTVGLQAVAVASSGIAWFVAVMWLNFVGGPQLGLTEVIVTGMLVMFLTLVLLVISKLIECCGRREESCKHRYALQMPVAAVSCA